MRARRPFSRISVLRTLSKKESRNNITTRGHHVSLVRTLGIGAEASIRAVQLP